MAQTPSSEPLHLPMKKKEPRKLGGRLAQIKEYNRTKSSSTSTLYIDSTVSTPNVDELLRSTAIKIANHIIHGMEATEKVYYEIFDERVNPLSSDDVDCDHPPSVDTIYRFVDLIFNTEQLSAECAIMMLAYIERMISLTGITIDSSNWRRVLLSTLILASKVWEDQAVWNVDFCSVFPNVTTQDLGQLEKVLLRLLQYNVSLQSGHYTKYYFELRELAGSRHFPLKPLDREGAKRLESRSATEEENARNNRDEEGGSLPRSKSLDRLQKQKSRPLLY